MHRRLGHTDRLVILKKPFDNIEILQLASALTEKWRLTEATKHRLRELEALVERRTVDLHAANARWRAQMPAERRYDTIWTTGKAELAPAALLSPDSPSLPPRRPK
jgi:hypothetical protein